MARAASTSPWSTSFRLTCAIRYGYERYETRVMFEVIVILIALVSIVQFAGEWLARRADHKR
jgi:D-methionine transport system permease protein